MFLRRNSALRNHFFSTEPGQSTPWIIPSVPVSKAHGDERSAGTFVNLNGLQRFYLKINMNLIFTLLVALLYVQQMPGNGSDVADKADGIE